MGDLNQSFNLIINIYIKHSPSHSKDMRHVPSHSCDQEFLNQTAGDILS